MPKNKNKSKCKLKLAENTNTSNPVSTLVGESQSPSQRQLDGLRFSHPSTPAPHAMTRSPTPKDASHMPSVTTSFMKNRPDFARDKVVAGSEGKGFVAQGVSEAHFFKDAKNFEIKDMEINSAGRDVYKSVTTNYFEDQSLSMIPYAEGAGIDTTKACLDGTRTDILAKVDAWLTTTDLTTPRVLWISGPAGTGKSAIAHTVARRWIADKKGIGSCFCFNQQVANRHQKLFSTIARDLAGRIPEMKDYLIKLVTTEPTTICARSSSPVAPILPAESCG